MRLPVLLVLLTFSLSALGLTQNALAHAFEAREHRVFAEYQRGELVLVMHHVGEADAHEGASVDSRSAVHAHASDHVYELSGPSEPGLTPEPTKKLAKAAAQAVYVPVSLVAYSQRAQVSLHAPQPPPGQSASHVLIRSTRLLL